MAGSVFEEKAMIPNIVVRTAAIVQIVGFLMWESTSHTPCPPSSSILVDNFVLPICATGYVMLVVTPLIEWIFQRSKIEKEK
jgi:hypothetical protein